MAKSCTTNAAAASHGCEKHCVHAAHEAKRVADDDHNSSKSSNQDEFAHEAGEEDDAVAALVVWDDHCEQDEPMAQVLEAIRLGLDKETKSHYIRDCDYMKQIQRHGMKNAWRVKICRWMFETGKAFELSVDTVGCAISYMDQFLSVESVDKIMMQLLSLVCVFSASKVHDQEPITLDELNLLCESRFSKQDFCRVEMHLLRILKWELNPPNTFTFARDFVHTLALEDADEIMETVTELLKFVAEDYGSIGCKTSAVALAAVQLINGSCSSAASLQTSSKATDEFTSAFSLVQRAYASTFPQQQQASQQEEDSVSDPALDVTSSPIAVENHPHMSIMEDIELLKHMLTTPAAAATTTATSSGSSTQRALFNSPEKLVRTLQTKQHKNMSSSSIASKKRQRAASLSLAH